MWWPTPQEFDLTRDGSDPPSDDMKSSLVLAVGSSAAEGNPEPIQSTQLENVRGSVGAVLGLDPLPSSFNHAESSEEHQTRAGAVVVAMRVDDSNGLPKDRVRRLSLFSGLIP